jgi:hypothetical protein
MLAKATEGGKIDWQGNDLTRITSLNYKPQNRLEKRCRELTRRNASVPQLQFCGPGFLGAPNTFTFDPKPKQS